MSEIDPAAPPYPRPSDRFPSANRTPPAEDGGKSHLWEDKEISFGDLLDAINPLQHIPIIATIYRHLTGDDIGNVARVVGDGLYGGPIGIVAGLASVAVKEETGKDPGDHVLALLTGDDVPPGMAPPAGAVASGGGAAETVADGQAASGVASHAPVRLAAAAHTPPAIPAGQSAASAAHRPVTAGPAQTASRGDAGDPVTTFQAQKAAFMRGLNGNSLSRPVLNTHPVPLQGFALATVGSGAHHPMVNLAALPPAGTTPPTANSFPAVPASLALPQEAAVIPPPALTPALSTALPAPGFGLPGGPVTAPIDIQQQMMDALDKYARMQRERGASRGERLDETK